jgi:acetoin utilization protein AcuB
MRREPRTIEAIDSLGTANRNMRENGIRHLPVMRERRLVGILSERDILEFRASLGFTEDWQRAPVSGAMTRSPQTAGPNDSLTEVAGRFAQARIGALPVVELGGLIGIVTVSDVLAGEVRSAMAPVPPLQATAADAMTPGAFTCRPEDSLLVAAKRMSLHGIRHLPVVDDQDVVIGVLSERELRTYVGDVSRFAATHVDTAMCVHNALTHPLVAVLPDRPLVEVATMFEDARIGAIPVVDRGGKLLGIISYVDALRLFARAARSEVR